MAQNVGEYSTFIQNGSVLKFKNKKLFGIDYNYEDERKTMVYAFNYGGFTVALPELNKPEENPTPEISEVVSEKVTAEEWNAAFSAENFKNCKLESIAITNNYSPTTVQLSVIEADGKGYVENIYETKSNGIQQVSRTQVYYQIKDGQIIIYERNESGNWEENKNASSMVTYYQLSTFMERIKSILISQIDSFEYNVEQKGYVAKSDIGNLFSEGTVIKFKDKKIVSIVNIDSVHSESMSYTFTYGGQTVTLPEITEASA